MRKSKIRRFLLGPGAAGGVGAGSGLRGQLAHHRLGLAECLKFHAPVGLGVASELLRADPAALLCNNPDCSVCPQARAIVEEHRTR